MTSSAMWNAHTKALWSAQWHSLFALSDDRSRLTWKNRFSSVAPVIYNFYSSGDEALEMGGRGIDAITFDGDIRQFTWQKQEFYKGRSWVYGTGWAGWGFESNVTATAVNAAAPATLRDAPIFEHDPDEMFSATITTNMQNSILAKGIPALSTAVGVTHEIHNGSAHILSAIDMNDSSIVPRPNGWCRDSTLYGRRWLHSDIQNISFFFTFNLFKQLVTNGKLYE